MWAWSENWAWAKLLKRKGLGFFKQKWVWPLLKGVRLGFNRCAGAYLKISGFGLNANGLALYTGEWTWVG